METEYGVVRVPMELPHKFALRGADGVRCAVWMVVDLLYQSHV